MTFDALRRWMPSALMAFALLVVVAPVHAALDGDDVDEIAAVCESCRLSQEPLRIEAIDPEGTRVVACQCTTPGQDTTRDMLGFIAGALLLGLFATRRSRLRYGTMRGSIKFHDETNCYSHDSWAHRSNGRSRRLR